MATQQPLGHVLVVGGGGFLGENMVQLLHDRECCTKITVLDVKPALHPTKDVEYVFGDITQYSSVLEIFRKSKPDAVIHTASPHANSANEILYKVNVDGTKNILKACQETGVKALVYTSSSSVIHDAVSDLINADETYPMVMGSAQPQYYTTTKAEAEMHVLAANRVAEAPHFLTAAIRPSGLFGVGDVQLIPPMLAVYYRNQTNFQLGSNDNLFDYTEITNVAHAHHLALAALMATRERLVKGQALPLDHEKVDGEAFLITNDSPVYFWDFTRRCWSEAGWKGDPSKAWVLSKDTAIFIATMVKYVYQLLGKGQPSLTPQGATYSCTTRYFNISKAKTRLGYRPIVSIDDGIRRGVREAIYRGAVYGQPQGLKGNAEVLKSGIPVQ